MFSYSKRLMCSAYCKVHLLAFFLCSTKAALMEMINSLMSRPGGAAMACKTAELETGFKTNLGFLLPGLVEVEHVEEVM